MENPPNIQARDKLLRDNFTPAETMLFCTVLSASLTVFAIGTPRSFWLLGCLLIFGCLTPVILKTHEHTHPFFVDLLWPRFWICSAPAWLLLLQFILGLTQDPLAPHTIAKTTYHSLEPIQTWRPTSVTDSVTWLSMLGFSASYLLASSLYMVPKSRSFFERTFPWLCFGAVLVAIEGYIQKGLGLNKPFFTKGTGQPDFFAFFPYDGHWAAFATLWCCACIAMALLSTRYEDSPNFIHSTGPWYLTGATLLGATGFIVDAPRPATILLLTLSVMLLFVTVEFLTQSKDPHRTPIAISSGLVACLSFAGGIFRLFQNNTLTAETSTLRNAAYEMFLANPIFGWGFDSFGKLLPFYGNDTLLGQRSERATSDFLQILAEFGIFGLALILGFFATFLLHYIKGKHNIQLTNHLLIGCGAICLLALFDSPFMSPAVFFSFMIIFFSALRWADLSRNKVDEVDAPHHQLVTPASQRRVPFFNQHHEDKEL